MWGGGAGGGYAQFHFQVFLPCGNPEGDPPVPGHVSAFAFK